MRHIQSMSLLASLLLVGACVAHPASQPAPKAARSVAPQAGASAVPERPAATTVPANAFISKTRLKPPAGDSVDLSGTVLVDAHYFVTTGGGQIVSNDGATAVFPGVSLIGQDGASVIAAGAGNIVANDGATIVANDGATLIGQDGSSLIGQDGSSVAARSAGSYRLAAASDLPIGAQLPAGAMLVRVIRLSDNRPVPLGVDEAGIPVYVVLTDAHGRYTLHLPTGLTGNVRVVASVPGTEDSHLTYNFVLDPALPPSSEVQDELAALGTFYVRTALIEQLAFVTKGPEARQKALDEFVNGKSGVGDIAGPVFDGLFNAAKKAGLDDMPFVRRQRVLTRFSDYLISNVSFRDMAMPEVPEYKPADDENAVATLIELFGRVTEKAADLMSRGDINEQPYIKAANLRRQADGVRAFHVSKPSDLGVFIIKEYMRSSPDDRVARREDFAQMLATLGFDATVFTRFSLAYTTIYTHLGAALVNGSPLKPLEDIIAEEKSPDAPRLTRADEEAADEPPPDASRTEPGPSVSPLP